MRGNRKHKDPKVMASLEKDSLIILILFKPPMNHRDLIGFKLILKS